MVNARRSPWWTSTGKQARQTHPLKTLSTSEAIPFDSNRPTFILFVLQSSSCSSSIRQSYIRQLTETLKELSDKRTYRKRQISKKLEPLKESSLADIQAEDLSKIRSELEQHIKVADDIQEQVFLLVSAVPGRLAEQEDAHDKLEENFQKAHRLCAKLQKCHESFNKHQALAIKGNALQRANPSNPVAIQQYQEFNQLVYEQLAADYGLLDHPQVAD